MPEPRRFKIQRIGDKYFPVPVHSTAGTDSWMYKFGGGALTLWGLHRGGLRGWFGAVVGAGLMYRGLTGTSPACYFFAPKPPAARDGDPRLTPSYQNDSEKRATML